MPAMRAGVITAIRHDVDPPIYVGRHTKSESDGKSTFRGYSEEFECTLEQLRVQGNLMASLAAEDDSDSDVISNYMDSDAPEDSDSDDGSESDA